MAVKEQAKHTPGPWELEKRECQSLGSIHYAIKTSYKPTEHGWSPRFIAWMAGSLGESLPHRRPDDYRDDPHVEADARLIAESPELLQVLKDIIEGFFAEYEDPNNLPDGPTTGAIARAQYIIAKVEGRS